MAKRAEVPSGLGREDSDQVATTQLLEPLLWPPRGFIDKRLESEARLGY